MLLTAIGINTNWGLLMASSSQDTRVETPLQVRLNGVATFIGLVGLYGCHCFDSVTGQMFLWAY